MLDLQTAAQNDDFALASSVMEACSEGHSWKMALRLVEDLPLEACQADRFLFLEGASACLRGSEWSASQTLLQRSMQAHQDKVCFGHASEWERPRTKREARYSGRLQQAYRYLMMAVVWNRAISVLENQQQWSLQADRWQYKVLSERIAQAVKVQGCDWMQTEILLGTLRQLQPENATSQWIDATLNGSLDHARA
eukprot:4829883-Amphidinium_carterae.1